MIWYKDLPDFMFDAYYHDRLADEEMLPREWFEKYNARLVVADMAIRDRVEFATEEDEVFFRLKFGI